MPPKHQILRLWSKTFVSAKPHKVNRSSLEKSLCTTTELAPIPDSPESPDLPTWLHIKRDHPETADPDDDDDDFIIPPLAKWVESHKLDPKKSATQLLPEEQVDDVSKLTAILKKRYPSMEAVVKALNGCGVTPTDALVLRLLRRFSNDWLPALGVFTWAKHQAGHVHTPELYNSMVDVLGKCKKFSLMWDLVKEMVNFKKRHVSLVTMTKVMRRLARAGKYEDSIEAFRGIENFGVRKDTEALNVLMDALVKGGSVERAQSMFVEFKDCMPINSNSFNILIHGYCKARMLNDARKTMDEMERRGFCPDVVSYTCFIEAYCKERDFRNVDAILEEMQQKGCKPSAITYTIIMHALGKAKQMKEALDVYEKMKANGCIPDAPFYSCLLFALGKSGRLKDAWDVFEDMKSQGVARGLLTYNTMISSSCAHLQEENALNLLQRMEEDSCKPDVETYAPLLKMCCRKKRMKVLKFLLSHMSNNDVSIDLGTYSLLVRGLCKSGKLEHACFFFEESVLKGMVPRDSIYKMLVEELQLKNMVETKSKIEKLVSLAKEPKII